jgi:hypothetical protein
VGSSSQHHEGVQSAHALGQQVADLQAMLRQQSNAHEQQAHESASAYTQLEHLNEVVVAMQKKLESVEADNRRLIQVHHRDSIQPSSLCTQIDNCLLFTC